MGCTPKHGPIKNGEQQRDVQSMVRRGCGVSKGGSVSNKPVKYIEDTRCTLYAYEDLTGYSQPFDYGDHPTRYMLKVGGRSLRVRSLCYGNCESLYVRHRKQMHFIRDLQSLIK